MSFRICFAPEWGEMATADVANPPAGYGKIYLRDDGCWVTRDSAGNELVVVDEAKHKALRDLIHFVDNGPADGFASGAFYEQTPATAFPTSGIWYTDNTKVDKIVELTVTYNANNTIATEVWKMYDTDGSTVLVTLTDTHVYSGVFLSNTTRTWA